MLAGGREGLKSQIFSKESKERIALHLWEKTSTCPHFPILAFKPSSVYYSSYTTSSAICYLPFLSLSSTSESVAHPKVNVGPRRNGRLGTNTHWCSTLHTVATWTPVSVTRKRQAAGVWEHEDQRQGHRRSHSHLLRHLRHPRPRRAYPYLHRLISDPDP
ncbi:hypothetical protein L1887_10116 [Cichorium endivia]|nr:hypothetical protein L1887_10116 [Cichorium endivia]